MSTPPTFLAIRIPFQIPLSPTVRLDRFVYAYVIAGKDNAVLVDCGVKGSGTLIETACRNAGVALHHLSTLVLTHAHPDHLGAAQSTQARTGCAIAAHGHEHHWIEDTALQFQQRPVPGFHDLVEGPVHVDRVLNHGDTVEIDAGRKLTVLHTPGHSPGSISLLHEPDGTVLCGDAIPLPGTMPIYDDVLASVRSLVQLQQLGGDGTLYSSWDEPRRGAERTRVIGAGLDFLQSIHSAVRKHAGTADPAGVAGWAGKVLAETGIPQAAANPLVFRSLAAHLAVRDREFLLE